MHLMPVGYARISLLYYTLAFSQVIWGRQLPVYCNFESSNDAVAQHDKGVIDTALRPQNAACRLSTK